MSSCVITTDQQPLTSIPDGVLSYLQIATHLSLLGVEVILVPRAIKTIVELQEGAVQVLPASRSRVYYLLNGLSVAKIVRKLLNGKKIDAVLSWDYEVAFLPRLLRLKGVVFGMIAAEPSYEMWLNMKMVLLPVKALADEWFRWRPFKQADVIFVSSSFAQEELVNLFKVEPSRIVNIHRGIYSRFKQTQQSFSRMLTSA